MAIITARKPLHSQGVLGLKKIKDERTAQYLRLLSHYEEVQYLTASNDPVVYVMNS